MNTVIIQAEELNLPSVFAVKLKGKKVKVSAKGETIIITPIQDVISNARGMFKDISLGTDTLMKQKQREKKLEYGE